MSLLTKKGPSSIDDHVQDKIRRNLSKELSRVVKKIQHDHISSDSAIRSGDAANAVCHVIEAIFLHGLKESFSNKLSSYFGSGNTGRAPQPSFWQFLLSFTHKDVVKQLSHLAHITTEVGQCRAWIRLALNDGLIESYLAAMLLDKKKLQQYYHGYSFLRDSEQPHIMKNYLQGMGDFVFQLSYNSSVLNQWGFTPLKLAGLEDIEETPLAFVSIGATPTDEADSLSSISNPVSIIPVKTAHGKKTKNKTRTMEAANLTQDESGSPSTGDFNYRECEMSSSLLATPPDHDIILTHSPQRGREDLKRKLLKENKEIEQRNADDANLEMEANKSDEDKDRAQEAKFTEAPRHLGMSRVFTPAKSKALPQVNDAVAEVTVAANRQDADVATQGYVECQNNHREEYIETGVAVGEDDELTASVGNSLIARSGWSSTFEKQLTPDTEIRSPIRERGESFGSLLQNYAPASRQRPSPTMAELLDQLPEKEIVKEQAGNEKPEDKNRVSIGGDFEVVPLSQSLASISTDPRTHALMAILTEISNEKGLDSQNYQCKGCSRPIGIIYGRAKVCSYDGCYYCYECHTDDEAIIPSRIIHNWDFNKHKVAKLTKLFLHQIEDEPLINIKQCNYAIYNFINDLNDVKQVRSQLTYLKAYLFTCKQSVAEELRRRVWPKEYMLDNVHLYSVTDLIQVQSGQLLPHLKKIINFAAKHVKNCSLCSQKGFICEICDSPKIIYPFDLELTVRCDRCKTVFHKTCKTELVSCPKCDRRRLRHVSGNRQTTQVDFASPWS
ncbi:pleckstrin homology domain-containing family M member 1-like [Saccoglossus kowalevskii]